MATQTDAVAVRRRLHSYPEPYWREFHTTSIVVDELERVGVDEVHVGPDALVVDERLGVPDENERRPWRERAEREGARADVLDATEGGATGAVGVVRRGDGPTVGLRVDIDGLVQDEATDSGHQPAAEGFRSEHDGMMHACGHDANTAIGLGALERVADSDFEGTFKTFFQPASEIEGGGKPMAKGPPVDDVDALFVVNVGFGHPTGEVVAGVEGMYAIERFRAEVAGESAHAAKAPEEGRNAIQAMSTAVSDLYAIPRHADGPTRVNVGTVDAGQATNVIADSAVIEGEVRGETTDLLRSMQERADRVLERGARMHGCEVATETVGEAPSADSDDALADCVDGVLEEVERVTSPVRRAAFGTGEDAAWLMNAVSNRGGAATHVIVGTDHPSGHHTSTFDVDEASIDIGVEVVARAALAIDENSE
jgi:aminobenzoyl-glutamate utilization protein A